MLLLIPTFAAIAVSTLAVPTPLRHSKSANLLSRAKGNEAVTSAGHSDPRIPHVPKLEHESASLSTNGTHFDTYGSAASRPPSCMRNTGVSCIANGCARLQGENTCKFGQCVCSVGCSSADGTCLHEANVLVASGIRLKNAKWPTYYMVASTMDSKIHVTSNSQDALARFNLYQLPGQGDRPKDFLLVPEGSPGYSVSVGHTYHCSDLMEMPGGSDEDKQEHSEKQTANLTSRGCKHEWKAEALPMSESFDLHPSVQDAGLRLWRAPTKQQGAITIRGSGAHVSNFMFVHDGSWRVSTREDDPGEGGYWIPEPPLPFVLPMYDGPPCQHHCSLGVRSTVTGLGMFLALAIAWLV